jgi:hypothetical protein
VVLTDEGDVEVLVPLALGVEQDDEDALVLSLPDVLLERGGVDPGEADRVRLGGDRLSLQFHGLDGVADRRAGELGFPAGHRRELFEPAADRDEERVVVVVDEDHRAPRPLGRAGRHR